MKRPFNPLICAVAARMGMSLAASGDQHRPVIEATPAGASKQVRRKLASRIGDAETRVRLHLRTVSSQMVQFDLSQPGFAHRVAQSSRRPVIDVIEGNL